MHSNSDDLWEQCGETCVQMLLELSCELDDECTGVEDKEVCLYFFILNPFSIFAPGYCKQHGECIWRETNGQIYI